MGSDRNYNEFYSYNKAAHIILQFSWTKYYHHSEGSVIGVTFTSLLSFIEKDY